MMKKSLFYLLALLLNMVAQGAWAENTAITYIERSWDETEKKVVETAKTISDYTIVSGSHSGEWLGLGGGDSQDHYYVVKGTVNYQTLNVFGRAHLILSNDAKLTCTGGIKVEKANNNAHIFIYGQTGDTGQLTVTNSYENAAGIGSSDGKECGEITIHGGTISVTGGKWAAGIGAGAHGSSSRAKDGITTIYGGNVTATGGEFGAGIGGGAGRGYGGCDGGVFSLYGGTVTATGGYYASGVGGGGSYQVYGMNSLGDGGKVGVVSIYGGTLNAQGGYRGAGIGGGNNSGYNYVKDCANGGTVNIHNKAIVNATGGAYGAGIGGGQDSGGANVTIDGGTVTATGGTNGAGIGGGENGDGSILTVNGGYVTAKATDYGAGIGGGKCTFTLNSVHGRGSNTYINGGTVIAVAGKDGNSRESSGASAIGPGEGVAGKSTLILCRILEIADNMMVTAGDSEDDIERVFTVAERIDACRWRNYVKIEACPHTKQNNDADSVVTTYTIADDTHHITHCRYCAATSNEMHFSIETCACGYQVKKQFTVYQAAETKNTYNEGTTTTVGAGNYFLLPECSNVPEGYIFAGWEMNPNPEDGNKWAAVLGDDFIQPQQAVKALAGQDNATFYPRFLYDFTVEWMWDDSYSKQLTVVRLTHKDISETINIHPTDVTSEDLLDDNNQRIGTRYKGTATLVKNGFTYNFTDVRDVIPELVLSDASDNTETLENNNGRRANVTLNGRTLYKNGSWNTLCLPFDVASFAGTPLEGATVKALTSSAFDNETGELTLSFSSDLSSIEAGKPYIVKWGKTADDTNPTFGNVTIKNVGTAVSTDFVTFLGSFSPVSLAGGDRTVIYLGAANTLYYPQADMTIGSCRALFVLNGITAGDKAEVRSFVLRFDEETTGVGHTEITEITEKAGAWYSLDGRKLSGKPAQRGVYINNGKKIIIK